MADVSPLSTNYVLSTTDRAKFKELWLEHFRQFGQPKRYTPGVETDDHQSPQFHVAKVIEIVTASGGDTAGTGRVNIYQAPGDDPDLIEVVGYEQDVLNIGGEIDIDEWVQVARDRYGRWWVITPGTGTGETTFLAVLVDKEFQGDTPVYSWARVIDAPPWGYVEVCPYVRGCPGHTPAYHEMNKDMPVVGAVPDDTGTGTGTPDPCQGEDGGLCPAPLFIHPKSVVRMHRYGSPTDEATGTGTGTDQGGYCMFGAQPWIDLFRRTGIFDEYGEIGYRRKYVQSAQGGGGFVDGEEVRIVEAD